MNARFPGIAAGTAGGAFLTLLFLFCPAAPAQQLHTYTDRDSLQAGDLFHYILVLHADREYAAIEFPAGDAFESEQIRFVERNRYRVSARRDSVVYTLQFFAIEDHRIPRMEVRLTTDEAVTDTLRSTELPLFFSTVIAEGQEEFRPLKPIFDFAALLWPWLLLLLLLAAAWYLARKFLNREAEPEISPPAAPPPFDDPLVLLQEELHALSDADSPLRREDYSDFYIRLGDAIRAYLERVHPVPALEMTTGEILQRLREERLDGQFLDSCRAVLQEADMVKFARFRPATEQGERALAAARRFLETAESHDREKIEALRRRHELESPSRIRQTEPA